MKKNLGYLFVILTALLWGSVAAVGKLLLTGLDSLQVLFFNSLFGFLALLAVVLFQKKNKIIESYKKRDYRVFAYMGFLGVFLYNFLLYAALSLLPAQEAFIINYLWPIMVIVFAAVILKENITLKKAAGIILSFIGVAIVITKGNLANLQFDNVTGILLALSAAIVGGFFFVVGKRKQYEEFTSVLFFYFFATIYSYFTLVFLSEIPTISLTQFVGLLWLGALTSGLGYVFWFLALSHGDTAKISNMIYLTPFISLVYIYFLVGEKILSSSVIGLVFIVSGILIQTIKKPNEGRISRRAR